MKRADAISLLRAHEAELRRMNVRTLSLFGSVARDAAREDSDIDVLVEFEGPPTFRGYMGLVGHLEDLFGRRVDVATPEGFSERAWSVVQRDLVRVA